MGDSRFTFADMADVMSSFLLKDIYPRGAGMKGNGRRFFISDYEIRKHYYKEGEGFIKVPVSAIISPLTLEWTMLKGIKIVRE